MYLHLCRTYSRTTHVVDDSHRWTTVADRRISSECSPRAEEVDAALAETSDVLR